MLPKSFRPCLVLIFSFIIITSTFALEKVSIALIDFKGNDVPENLCIAMTDAASTMLVNSGRFKVAEREQIRIILEQLAFEKTGMTENAVEIGRMLNVQKLIFGNISMTGKTYQINISLVDVEKAEREIQENHRFTGREDDLIEELEKVMEIIIGYIPLVGNIIGDTDKGFLVDFGTKQGIESGEKLVISREADKIIGLNGEVIGVREVKIAEAVVKSVNDSWCEIGLTTNTSAIIGKGYFVKLRKITGQDLNHVTEDEDSTKKAKKDTTKGMEEPLIPPGF